MNRRQLLSAFAVVALVASPAFAKKKADKKADKKAAAGEVYKIDTAASTIAWKGSKTVGSAHEGNVSIKDGQVVVTNQEFKSGKIVVDMNSITNKDLASSPDYQTKLITHLKSEDFFSVAKYPESTFNIKNVTKKTDTEYTVKGDLTMIGKTQPVEFPAQITFADNKMTGTANVKLDRTKWGLKYGSGKFFKDLGDKMISDEFELTLNIVANKDAAAATTEAAPAVKK